MTAPPRTVDELQTELSKLRNELRWERDRWEQVKAALRRAVQDEMGLDREKYQPGYVLGAREAAQRIQQSTLEAYGQSRQLDKVGAVSDTSQRIGEFLEWLREQNVHLMVWRTFTEPNKCGRCYGLGEVGSYACHRCGGTGNGKGTHEVESWDEDRRTINQLLADFFEIDLDKAERRAILAELGG